MSASDAGFLSAESALGTGLGALVFGELAGLSFNAQVFVVAGSLIMILGAVAIGRRKAKDNLAQGG